MPGRRRGTMFVNFITANQDLMLEFISKKKDSRERSFLDQYSRHNKYNPNLHFCLNFKFLSLINLITSHNFNRD